MTRPLDPPRASGAFPPAARVRPAGTPLTVIGVIGIVVGPLVMLLGGVIMILPMGLFLVGGGGNTDAFDDFAAAFVAPAMAVAIVGLLLLIGGIVAVVLGVRRRRASVAQVARVAQHGHAGPHVGGPPAGPHIGPHRAN